MQSKINTPAFPPAATAKLLTQKKDGTIESKQSCWGKLALLSNECGSPKEPSEISTRDRPPPTLSGLVISFGKTLPYLASKTVTRRTWKDSHASKFANAFDRNKLVKAFDKDRRYGGKQIGWCRLLCAPYKERLDAMPDEDLIAEGGMCSTVEEFVKRYFKGDSSQVVWVIRFEFVPLGVYPDLAKQTNTSSPIYSPFKSIYQDSLVTLGVYPASEKQTNINSSLYSRRESIHQTPLTLLGVYPDLAKQTNTNSPIPSLAESIHQTELAFLGVCQSPGKQVNTNSPVLSRIDSIHQDSLTPLGVYPTSEKQTNTNHLISSLAESVHQALLSPFGVYPAFAKQTNTNSPILSIAESIHQTELAFLGVYQPPGKQVNTNSPIHPTADSIHQGLSSDTNSAIPIESESTDASPAVQGGSGLVYSFWKGESIVNHYRYKVKIGGKWKVKSIYIPTGKLPQVKEAIANKLRVAAIVVEILGKQL